MAGNEIHIDVSDNQVNIPLSVGSRTLLRSVEPNEGSPYYVGARAYVTQTAGGATITIIDKEGTTTANVLNGARGNDGNGILTIGKTGTSGNVDTYTIYYTDGYEDTFEVTNGVDGQDGQDGADGFSPSATVTKVGDTATITITDKDGTTTASISDGGGGGGASAFVAEFNVTTYADVKDAYDDGSILICTVDDSGNTMTLQLVYFDVANELFYFAFPMSDGWYWTQVSNADGWGDGQFYFASTDVATQLRDGLMSALDKQKLDGLSKRNIWYGTCSTSASQSPKAITTASGDFELTTGSMLCVLFSHANSLSSASLQVDSGTAKAAYSMDGTSDIANRWGSNEVVMFAYDGTKFILLEQGKASTTAYGITKLNNTTNSTSTSEAATANAVKAAYDNGGVQSVNGNTGAVTVTVPTKVSDLSNDSGFTSTSVTQVVSTGTKIATVTIDGTGTDLYAPSGGGGGITDVEVDGTSVVTGGVAEIDLTGKSDVGHTHTKSAITDFPTIPSNTSDLVNDSGFITSSDIPTEIFIATYNSTSFADVETAYNAGKAIFVKDGENFVPLTNASSTQFTFKYIETSGTGRFSWYALRKNSSPPWYNGHASYFVQTTRKINGQALSADVTLTASDVSALPSSTVIPSDLSDLNNDMNVSDFPNDAGYITLGDLPIYNGGVS